MLLLQAPGSFLVVGFQISANSDWTSWVPYGVAGIEQLVLIGMLLWFKWRDRDLVPLEEMEGEESKDESTPFYDGRTKEVNSTS